MRRLLLLLLKVVGASRYWRSWWSFDKAFRRSQMLLRRSVTVDRPLFFSFQWSFKVIFWGAEGCKIENILREKRAGSTHSKHSAISLIYRKHQMKCVKILKLGVITVCIVFPKNLIRIKPFLFLTKSCFFILIAFCVGYHLQLRGNYFLKY